MWRVHVTNNDKLEFENVFKLDKKYSWWKHTGQSVFGAWLKLWNGEFVSTKLGAKFSRQVAE